MNKTKIHEALHYVHFWYKQIGTKEAVRQAIQVTGLDDKEAGQMAKAIAQYANEGTVPTFSNGALKAIFSLFRSTIELQRESSAKRSEINTANAMSKKSAAKKKVAKKLHTADSESQ